MPLKLLLVRKGDNISADICFFCQFEGMTGSCWWFTERFSLWLT